MVKMSYYAGYTDGHDVDEDSRTISMHGGWWSSMIYGNVTGIAEREINYASFSAYDFVASNHTNQKKNKHHPPR